MLSFYLSMLDDEDDKIEFEKIYRKYRSRMYNKAYSILKNQQDSEDAVHDAFLYIAKNFKNLTLKSIPKMEALLAIIIRHTSIDIYRKNKRNSQHTKLLENNDVMVKLDFFENFEIELLKEAISKLPDTYKDAIYLYYQEDYSPKKIAEMSGVSTSMVYKRIEYAKKLLKEYLLKGDKNG